MKELRLPLATPVALLVLIGGGEFSFGETHAIDELLLSRMPHGNPTVAFLPTASGSAEYATHFGAYLKEIRPDVETVNVPIYRGRDSRRQRNLSQILSAGMTYLGGGVTNQLLATLRETAAEMALREAAAGGAVVAAIGASASSFGSWTRDMLRGGGPLQGLGWLPNVVVEAGFDPAKDVPLRRLMSIPEVEIGIGIPPRTALVIQGDGTAEVAGEGSLAVVRRP
ncbi:MAG TPA: Type 1 glutamine amidotransferase-like domain-containing protein [Thermoanaerobaculia bacterium]|nr:Type 1 glutamine amidotransferase-like domain-containing protein [Thermoanaerobaculia bacterium]